MMMGMTEEAAVQEAMFGKAWEQTSKREREQEWRVEQQQ